MTVAKKMELPVKNEKDRMIDRVTNYPQAVHDRAALKAAIAIKNVYAQYDGVCGVLDNYFNQLYINKEEFIPQGEQHKRWLLTCAFGLSQTETETEQKLDKFFHSEAMEKLNRLIEEQNNQVVRFTKLQSKDN